MSKEYVFIGNAQNKTRDFINQLIKENKDLQHQLEEKQKIIDKLLRKYNEETCTIDFSMTIEDFNQLLEMLEIGKNE